MKKNYTIIQDGQKECGCACLLSIIRYYGGNVSINRLLELTNTTKDGTNFYDITMAAQEIGLSAKGYKVDKISEIYKISKPFISQIIIDNYKHFVVVYEIKNEIITIMDPAKGMVKSKIAEFNKLWTNYILILRPYKQMPFYHENNFLSKVLKQVIKDNKNIITSLVAITFMTTIFTTIYGFYFKIIIDHYQTANKLTLLCITIVFTVILIIKILMEYLRNNLLIKLNKIIDSSLINTAIKKIIYLPYSYYKNKTTGEVIARINDLFFLKHIITKIVITIFLDLVLAIFIMGLLLKINHKMTYLLFIIITIYFLIFIFIKPRIIKTTKAIQISNAKVNSLLTETIGSYATIKGLAIEDIFTDKVLTTYQNSIDNNINLTKINNKSNLYKNLSEGIILFLLIYFGIENVINQNITLGTFFTYNTLLFYFITPIRNALDFYQECYYAKNSLNRVNNLLNYKYESLDKTESKVIQGDIRLNKLSFGYQTNKLILKDITLHIEAKSRILILGKSGSGKSTILKLIYRYYESPANQIFIDNQDIMTYPLAMIRNSITYVSQNEMLYTDTLKNNIVLNRNISEDDFNTVCKLTYVNDIVKDNCAFYNIPLEENGANLSGGERQRIILARSLLKPAKIILIDEGLNQVDINLEHKILTNIFNYYQDKTFIIISHRKSNFNLYDNCYKLVNGHFASVNNMS